MSLRNIAISNPEIMGGALVFKGTRVPVLTFFDYLHQGSSLEDFLEGLPTVKREYVLTLLDEAKDSLLEIAKSST